MNLLFSEGVKVKNVPFETAVSGCSYIDQQEIKRREGKIKENP